MTAGQLSHRVTIQAPMGVLDEANAVSVDSSVPAAIAVFPPQFQPREGLAVGGLQAPTFYTVSVRYREDIRAAYVLREECCTQRTFQIVSVIPGDRKDVIDMTCVTNG